jgi:hypothetical protein
MLALRTARMSFDPRGVSGRPGFPKECLKCILGMFPGLPEVKLIPGPAPRLFGSLPFTLEVRLLQILAVKDDLNQQASDFRQQHLVGKDVILAVTVQAYECLQVTGRFCASEPKATPMATAQRLLDDSIFVKTLHGNVAAFCAMSKAHK